MDAIDELLTRAVDKIYPTREALEKLLRSGKKLRLYQGFDPSGIQLHIGHMTGLMKLRQFQKLGHHVIFLIGDGTGQAGDPSGKKRTREKFLTRKELRQNARDYVMQAAKLVDFEGKNAAEILYNGDWLNKLTLIDLLNLAGHFSLQQLEERDMFIERKKRSEEINMREFLYPLLQGYDSVAMSVDLELGGSDQTFNMLAGRKLVREIQSREKFVMTTPLLTDSSGKKIGKTEGNVIALTSTPNDLFGMVMSLPDDMIAKSFEYITDLPLYEVRGIEKKLASGENPMTYKKKLAFTLVRMLNDESSAKDAQKYFETTFQQKQLTGNMPTLHLKDRPLNIVDMLLQIKFAASRSDAKRLVLSNAVDIDGETISDTQKIINIKNDMVVQVGKHKFVKIKI